MMQGFIAIALVLGTVSSFSGDIISDLTTSSADESQALEIKKTRFWQAIVDAAERQHIPEHLRLCAEAEEEIAQLPAENDYVRTALSEAVMRLRRSNEALLQQAVTSAEVAEGKLSENPNQSGGGFFLSGFGGADQKSIFSRALRHFVGDGPDGKYSERLNKDVKSRQADVLPVLQEASSMTGSVLEDCRLSSQRSFDVLKYDIYNKGPGCPPAVQCRNGVPRTPEDAKALAYKIVDASAATRKQFTSFIMAAVGGIVDDVQGRHEQASVTMVKSALMRVAPESQGMEQLINL